MVGVLAARTTALAATALALLVAAAPSASAQESPAVGSIVIDARVAEPAPDATPSFTYAVSCTGSGTPIDQTVTVRTAAGAGSAAVEGIPADMACVIIEEPAKGWRIETSNPQAAVVSAEGTHVEFMHTARVAPAIALTKTSFPVGGYADDAAPGVIHRGDVITYSVAYKNAGSAVSEAVIVDEIPAGTTFVERPAPLCEPKCPDLPTLDGNRIAFTVSAAAGATGRVAYSVQVNDDAAVGLVLRGAAEVQPAAAGSESSNPVLHKVAGQKGSVEVVGRVDKTSAEPGEVVTYTLSATNFTPAVQNDVVISDALPANAEYVDGSAACRQPCVATYDAARNTVRFAVPQLTPGLGVAGLTFQVKIRPLTRNPDGSLPGTVLLNSAVLSSNETPAAMSNEMATTIVSVLGKLVSPSKTPTGVGAEILADTGAPTGQLIAAAVSLLVMGAGLVLAGKRAARPTAV